MPLPVVARSVEERELLTSLPSVRVLFDLVARADVTFVGVGSIGDSAPLVQDGIITRQEAEAMRNLGAVGEIAGWAFDAAGRTLAGSVNARVTGLAVTPHPTRVTVGVGAGAAKVAALRGALIGSLVNAVITDEPTAAAILGGAEAA
jgi:DNA-binding transcriptional regulator LsrR (DeoR family)